MQGISFNQENQVRRYNNLDYKLCFVFSKLFTLFEPYSKLWPTKIKFLLQLVIKNFDKFSWFEKVFDKIKLWFNIEHQLSLKT